MGKDRFVIKTGAGDYLEKGYPHVKRYAIDLSFITDIKQARIFYNYQKAEEVLKSCFLKKCEIIKVE